MPALVEYHPQSGLPMVEQAGAFRVLGCLPPHPRTSLPAWGLPGAPGLPGAAPLTLPPSAWQEGNLHASWPAVTTDDQGQSESCTGHATRKVFSYAWLAAGGRPREFSPTFLYALANGGQDAGAVISDLVTAAKSYGLCEAAYCPEGMLFRPQVPAAAFANARRFRVVEAYQCRTFADLCSALTLGFAVVSGILVGQNFGDLDGEGVAPLPDRVLGGHALCHVGLKYSRRLGQWLVLTQNSWSERWGMQDATGQGGFCYLTEAHWRQGGAALTADAWALVGVYEDPEDAANRLPPAA